LARELARSASEGDRHNAATTNERPFIDFSARGRPIGPNSVSRNPLPNRRMQRAHDAFKKVVNPVMR